MEAKDPRIPMSDEVLILDILSTEGPWRTNWMEMEVLMEGPLNAVWLDSAATGAYIEAYKVQFADELAEAALEHTANGTVGYANCPPEQREELQQRSFFLPNRPKGLWPVERSLIQLEMLAEKWRSIGR